MFATFSQAEFSISILSREASDYLTIAKGKVEVEFIARNHDII